MTTVLVNYTGGYCGSFFCGLIAQNLDVGHRWLNDERKNIFYFLSDEIDTKYIKIFGKLFEIRRGTLKKEDLKYIADNNLDDYYAHAFHLYKIVHDEDDREFIQNIKSHYRELMNEKKNEFFITTIHYGYQYKDLTLQDIFDKAVVLHIVTKSKKYARYFHLLFHYKTKDDEADKVLQSKTLSADEIYSDFIDPSMPKIFDESSIPVDMGRIIFERDEDHLEEIEAELTRRIGKVIKIDRMRLNEYADKNVKILKSILGEDFMNQSESEQIEKSLQYIEREVRAKQ